MNVSKAKNLESLQKVVLDLDHLLLKEDSSEFLKQAIHRMKTNLAPVENALILDAQVAHTLLVGSGVTLACSSCFRTNADIYYLRKHAGKYSVLCFNNGLGCWEASARACCSYVDQHSAQCDQLAEFEVVYGPDGVSRRSVCSLHVGAVLMTDISEHKIYPLDID